MLTFHLEGTVEERIDRGAGRYEVRVSGQGEGIANRIESNGMLRDGRWVPLRGASWFQVRGRESRTQVTYDYGRRVVEYHARGETFFLRKLRVVDDVVPLPDGVTVDDALTALLNYRDGYWKPHPDGRLRTHVVRRRRSDNEGPDDVARSYRAELMPLELRIEPDPQTRTASALLDLSGFSSWARQDRPARIVFDTERRPALITTSMILGTSLTIRLG
ncbi:MAG TPA: hypothetical protein VFV05_11820 [Methylomirabilota bacterium]|nr:hypothetical protein [Methylomirabilota bacterium]